MAADERVRERQRGRTVGSQRQLAPSTYTTLDGQMKRSRSDYIDQKEIASDDCGQRSHWTRHTSNPVPANRHSVSEAPPSVLSIDAVRLMGAAVEEDTSSIKREGILIPTTPMPRSTPIARGVELVS